MFNLSAVETEVTQSRCVTCSEHMLDVPCRGGFVVSAPNNTSIELRKSPRSRHSFAAVRAYEGDHFIPLALSAPLVVQPGTGEQAREPAPARRTEAGGTVAAVAGAQEPGLAWLGEPCFIGSEHVLIFRNPG